MVTFDTPTYFARTLERGSYDRGRNRGTVRDLLRTKRAPPQTPRRPTFLPPETRDRASLLHLAVLDALAFCFDNPELLAANLAREQALLDGPRPREPLFDRGEPSK